MSEKKSSAGKKVLKVFLFILVICAPIIILMVVFTPFASKKITKRIVNEYKLPPEYQQQDIVDTVKKMSRDREFLFYFFALSKDSVAEATYESYEIMNRARDQKKLYDEMMLLQEKAKAFAVMFYHLDYTDDFIARPDQYPDLGRIMQQFLFEEFKLAIIGVCYKSTYDENFIFNWDDTSRLAAQKLHKLIQRLSQK